MRPLTWAGIVVAGVLLLVVLAVALLPSLVNLERYRTLLAQRAGKALGREITLDALQVSLWRGMGVEAKGVRVGQAPGFGPEPFLSADALRVRLQLLPLLRGQVKVSSAVLERPRIRLVRARDGRWSLDDLFKSHPTPGPVRPLPEGARPSKAPLLWGLVLSEVAIRDGEIALVEQSRSVPLQLTLADVDLRLRQESPFDPIDLHLRSRLDGGAAGHLEAKGRITIGEKSGPTLDGTILLTGVELKAWQALLPAGGGGPILHGPFSGEVRLAGLLPQTAFSGSLNLTLTAVRIGGALRKPAGEEARITFQGQREGGGVRCTKCTLAFRDMTLEGTAHLADVRTPRIVFAASSPKVSVDRLLAPGTAQRTGRMSGLAWAAPLPSEAPTEPSNGISAQGRVRIAELTYGNVAWNGVEADVRYQGGMIHLPDVRGMFAQGTFRAKGEVDLRQRIPRASLTLRVEKAATGPLVKALGLGPWSLTSGLDCDAQTEFVGLVWPDLLGSAMGGGSVLLREGRLLNYRPLDRLSETIAPFLAAQGMRVRLNEFDTVSAHYSLDKGVLRTRDFMLTKPEGTIAAAGSLSLLDGGLDFDVVAKFGRTMIEAKLTGTTLQPIVVPKLDRLQQRIERELDKALPEGQSQGLKDLLRGLFRR
jgi:AsmA protein